MPIEAGDIVAGLTALGIEPGVFIGTSRGGLIIHLLAAITAGGTEGRHPQRYRAGGRRRRPGAYPRLSRTGAEAEELLRTRSPSSAPRMARHFTALADSDWERMVDALYRHDDGAPVPDFDPKLLNMLEDFDLNKPLPELWPQFDGLAGDSACWPFAAPIRTCCRQRRSPRWHGVTRTARR